jgi:hypothetical protein
MHSRLSSDLGTDANLAFQFFLSIPAWIFLTMAPRYSRTRKFAQPRVMIAVDMLFAIIWLSAFSTQAAYNTANLCGSACGISKAIVGLGFFVLYASPAPLEPRGQSLTCETVFSG